MARSVFWNQLERITQITILFCKCTLNFCKFNLVCAVNISIALECSSAISYGRLI